MYLLNNVIEGFTLFIGWRKEKTHTESLKEEKVSSSIVRLLTDRNRAKTESVLGQRIVCGLLTVYRKDFTDKPN